MVRLASPFVENGIKGVRREVRAEALALLRHYPFAWLSENGDFPAPENGAKRDILTDEDREAVESAIWDYQQNDDDEDCARMVATLERLLERMA